MVAHFDFDELPESGRVRDLSPNSFDASLAGGATVESGGLRIVPPPAAPCSSTVEPEGIVQRMLVPGGVLNGRMDFSFAARVRIENTAGSRNTLLSAANGPAGSGNDNEVTFFYRNRQCAIPDARPTWRLHIQERLDQGDTLRVIVEDARIEDHGWHHVAIARSGSTGTIYLDGLPMHSAMVPAAPLVVAQDGLVVGHDQDDVGTAFQAFESWGGSVDDVRFYSRALTAAEVALLACQGQD